MFVWWYLIIECLIDFNCLKMSEVRFWGDRNVECWVFICYYFFWVDLEEWLGLDCLVFDCFWDGGLVWYLVFFFVLCCVGVLKMWWVGIMGGLNLYIWVLVGCFLMWFFLCSWFMVDWSILYVLLLKGLLLYFFFKWCFSLCRLVLFMCLCLSVCFIFFSSEK